jgi:phosphate transport system substrate-binding protein
VNSRMLLALGASGALALGVAACGGDDSSDSGGSGGGSTPTGLSGSIRIDGSSTVGPLTQAVAEQFQQDNPDVNIAVGESGTGGGFEKFCAGETAINDASREIEPEEAAICKKNDVTYDKLQVANDALTVVVNNNNPNDCLSVKQLNEIWRPDNPVSSWADVSGADAGFDAGIERFGPGTTSGTFDYFTDAINGEEGVQTKDYNNVGENDNQTVQGVEGSEGGIGYFGYSYYEENQGNLKALQVENPDSGECVEPSQETVQSGDYAPLGRPLFIYPSSQSMNEETTKAFVQYYLDNVNQIAPSVGFIPMTDQQLNTSQQTLSGLS